MNVSHWYKHSTAWTRSGYRIYKADNTYHVVSVSTNVTVAALTPKLDQKVPAGEFYVLYLKECGRERIFGADGAAGGYCATAPGAGGDLLDGGGLTFLLKFVYKSLFHGPAEEVLKIDNFEHIDLTGRSLETVPVVLHQHADSIVSLRLSRNLMVEIPLDFIQSCTTLRELRLSHMAMEKVPHNLRHSTTLTRLDLSCNRIVTLDEAYLDDIPGLTTLYVQNNRLEKLPWSFPRLRRLITLNISNNKFRMFPAGVSELTNLRDLDISFNMISELPEEIGNLKNLERLVIVGNQVSKLPDEFSNLGRLGELDCRRNQISDLTVAYMLPKIETLSADHNALHELTSRSCGGRWEGVPFALTHLDVSNAKLSMLDDYTLSQLTSLRRLKLDSNCFPLAPRLRRARELALGIGREVPPSPGSREAALDNRASLSRLNVDVELAGPLARSAAIALSFWGRRSLSDIPPLAHSLLEMLYLGENSFTDEVLHPLMILKELRGSTCRSNDIQDMPL
ncbi:Adenylate cyclase [Mycena venus]|uniref:Adenylate cyclase n=1 Tax=Mycena venus TaxID=2733690 RepID=A0A8H7D3U8_9AGAR|nr:Adenylate cyclase [Mycena venus]